MAKLYPVCMEANQSGKLQVDELHRIAWWEYGNPKAPPILLIHGGPGAGSDPDHLQNFDPQDWRIFQLDQRGCGDSTPHASLQDNTTDHLIEDMECLRSYLGIDSWALSGGSWGTTLALAYAQYHPQRVAGLLLRGVFLARQMDINWLYERGGAARLRPEAFAAYEQFASSAPSLLDAYGPLLAGEEPEALQAARAMIGWEDSLCRLVPTQDAQPQDAQATLAMARLEQHYLSKRCFLRENQLLEDLHLISHLPLRIVHGRYDLVCPLEQAWELHQNWEGSTLEVVEEAGHSSREPGIADAMTRQARLLAADLSK